MLTLTLSSEGVVYVVILLSLFFILKIGKEYRKRMMRRVYPLPLRDPFVLFVSVLCSFLYGFQYVEAFSILVANLASDERGLRFDAVSIVLVLLLLWGTRELPWYFGFVGSFLVARLFTISLQYQKISYEDVAIFLILLLVFPWTAVFYAVTRIVFFLLKVNLSSTAFIIGSFGLISFLAVMHLQSVIVPVTAAFALGTRCELRFHKKREKYEEIMVCERNLFE